MASTSHNFLHLVIFVASAVSAIYGNPVTCYNEERLANKEACQGQRFGELVPYPGDCSKFLLCNCEYPTVKQCPGGTWFDNKIKVCNYPQNVDCKAIEDKEITTPPNKTSTPALDTTDGHHDCEAPAGMSLEICLNYEQGFLIPYPYNCNAYINCTEGCPIINYCQSDKVFNKNLKICDTPDTAQCKDLALPASTSSTTTEELNTYTTNTFLTTEESSNKFTISQQPDMCITPSGISNHICSVPNHNKYQSYAYNCSAYIKCQGELACLEFCDTGKIFNSVLEICDEDIECQETDLITLATIDSTTPFKTTGVTSSLPPHVDPGLCQGKKDYAIYNYEENCSKYLLCKGGEVKFQRCPDGWFFNAKFLICDEGLGNLCSGDESAVTEDSLTTETNNKQHIRGLCQNHKPGTTFPYANNCQLYYYCRSDGDFYTISCPFDNFYDPKTGNCGPDVSPQACLESETTSITPTYKPAILTPQEKCANEIFGATFAYEDNCAKYIFCKGNQGFIVVNCPYDNYYYPASGNCGPSYDKNICRKTPENTLTTTTLAASTTSQPDFDICSNKYAGQLVPYPLNCEKYISCVRPIPIGFNCPQQWRFNEQQQKCVQDFAGTCKTLSTNETSTYNKTHNICQGLEKGSLQVNTDNCQLYYECLGNDIYMLKACNEELYFDPVKQQCRADVSSDSCWHYSDSTLVHSTVTPNLPQMQDICQGQLLGAQVNYPHKCSKYVICENPIPVAYSCVNGLQFSLERQDCVKPSEADCPTSSITTTIATTTPITQTPSTTTTSNQCTNKSDFTLLPYETDCSMLLLCLQDQEHLVYCENDEYFDIALEKCSTKANVHSCLLKPTSDPSITPTTEPNYDPCHGKTDGTKIPYPFNCTKYIECQQPLNVGYDCPQGLEFSKKQQNCVLPELADCSIQTSSATEETTLTPTLTTVTNTLPPVENCEHKSTGSTLTYLQDCSKYYMCIKGKEKLTNCMPASYYNPLTGECDPNISPNACSVTMTKPTSETPVTTTTEKSAGSFCYNKTNGFMYANIQNCSQYFMCLQASSLKCVCQNNAFYNPDTNNCEKQISNTACQGQNTITTEAQTATSKSSTMPVKITTQQVITSTTAEPLKDNICCGQQTGTILAHPIDPTKYVICQYPLPEIFTCPEDRIYEVSSSSCILKEL